MMLAGDEFLRTKQGNNNAWCQDNELNWIDWSLADYQVDFQRFVTMLIALRKRHPALRRYRFFRGSGPLGDLRPDVIWHGVEENQPDFSPGSRTLAFALDGSLTGREPDRDFYIVCNAWIDTVEFQIPRIAVGPGLAARYRHGPGLAPGHRRTRRGPARALRKRLSGDGPFAGGACDGSRSILGSTRRNVLFAQRLSEVQPINRFQGCEQKFICGAILLWREKGPCV